MYQKNIEVKWFLPPLGTKFEPQYFSRDNEYPVFIFSGTRDQNSGRHAC